MKDYNLGEIFCEVLSGMIAILVLLLFCDLAGTLKIVDFTEFLKSNMNVGFFSIIFILCYLIGLLVDALGLTLGEWFIDSWSLLQTTGRQQLNMSLSIETRSGHIIVFIEIYLFYLFQEVSGSA